MNNPLPSEPKLIGTYSRVSTSNQELEQTVQNQLLALKEYSEKHGYKIVENYIDEGWSGDNIERPDLDRLRMDVKSKKWSAVLIYDPDRLARRYSYQQLLIDELTEAGIEVMFITRPAPKDPMEKVLYGVQGIFSEYERMKIAERFRLGKLRKVKEGHLLLSEGSYGYTYIPKKGTKHGYYEINEIEARIVNMIFKFIADDGFTIRQVVKKLHELGIKPRKSKREVWNTSTIGHLLRNRVYIGEAHWGKSYSVVPVRPFKQEKYKKVKKSSRRIRSKDEWYTIPTPPIIDRDLFQRTQEQLVANFDLSWRNKKNSYLLGGLIYCGCGRRRCGEGPQKGKHLYYRCNDRVKSFPLPRVCFEKGVNARVVDDMVWEEVSKLMSSSELIEKQIASWLKRQNNKPSEALQSIDESQKESTKLKEQETRYNHAYAQGIYTFEDLKTYLAPVRERIAYLEDQIAKVRSVQKEVSINPLPSESEIRTFAEEAKEALKDLSFEQKRGIILGTVEKVVAVPGKMQISGYISVSPYVEYKSIYRHCRTSKCWEINAF